MDRAALMTQGAAAVADVQLVPVRTPQQMRLFVDLPWRIYEGERNWVPPLKTDVRRILDPRRHPFWQFASRELFLAMRGDEPVGRIAAIVDRNYNEFHHERMGAWGFFECRDDQRAADSLFAAAEDWVRAQGMDFLRGPLNPSTNYDVGMLIEGFQYPPAIMMPYNPRYYIELATSYGLQKEKDLIAHLLDYANAPSERTGKLAARIRRNNNITIRSGRKKNFESELALIKEIYHASWSRNWGFVPMTDAEMDDAGQNLVRILDPDLVLFVQYNGQPVGVCLIVPDINPILKRLNGRIGLWGVFKAWRHRREITGLRAVLFGIKHEYQKLGLPLVVFDHLNQLLREEKQNYTHMELGWTLEDNDEINRYNKDIGGREYKRFRIFRKDF
jgi:hypothetical protein